ncbi:MAG TPA: TetR/AcrR family transcriptional regulator [Blastocatellia bacterium]|nr:TetR/AcrR family transcriptional regulator [Blastocatellia bacterium]
MGTVKRASSTARKANGKYEAILRAAIKVFAGSGFFNSKVADVAREAGVADGTVYLYFKNKDDILASIFNHYMENALAAGRARLAEINHPVEKLRRIVHAHLEGLGRDRNLAVVFQVELRSSSKFMEQFSATKVTEYLELIREVIEEGQQSGVFRSGLNTKIAAKVLFGALDEMATNWVLSHKRYSLVSTAEPVLDVFLNGIAHVQPSRSPGRYRER